MPVSEALLSVAVMPIQERPSPAVTSAAFGLSMRQRQLAAGDLEARAVRDADEDPRDGQRDQRQARVVEVLRARAGRHASVDRLGLVGEADRAGDEAEDVDGQRAGRAQAVDRVVDLVDDRRAAGLDGDRDRVGAEGRSGGVEVDRGRPVQRRRRRRRVVFAPAAWLISMPRLLTVAFSGPPPEKVPFWMLAVIAVQVRVSPVTTAGFSVAMASEPEATEKPMLLSGAPMNRPVSRPLLASPSSLRMFSASVVSLASLRSMPAPGSKAPPSTLTSTVCCWKAKATEPVTKPKRLTSRRPDARRKSPVKSIVLPAMTRRSAGFSPVVVSLSRLIWVSQLSATAACSSPLVPFALVGS